MLFFLRDQVQTLSNEILSNGEGHLLFLFCKYFQPDSEKPL